MNSGYLSLARRIYSLAFALKWLFMGRFLRKCFGLNSGGQYKSNFLLFLFFFLGITVFAQTDWVSVQPGGNNFNFQNPQVKIPSGYNDVLIGDGLQYLIPDRENDDPNLTYNYLDNLDDHRVSLIRISMENPMRVTYSSKGDPFYFNSF